MMEKLRLVPDRTHRPSTKWRFLGFGGYMVKVVLDKTPVLDKGLLLQW